MSTLGPISGTGGISTDTSRIANQENLDAAGKRFEAIFVGMMLKSMRSTKLADGLFDNKATQQFRDMQDQQFAQSMATHAPIGIGKAMTDFLSRAVPADAAPAAATGEAGKGSAA